MIDWHTHILPQMDDGSHSTKESIALLHRLLEQGADTVAATPHFNANAESVNAFLERRAHSYNTLKPLLFENAPRLLLGAEVKYYPGISRLVDLKSLCIENSRLLLLEMPFSKWTEYTVRELIELSGRGNITIMLAHIERYIKFQNRNTWTRFQESDITMQVNASFFTSFSSRHKALSMLNDGAIHFIGSDCHNTTTRPPLIGSAYEIIEKKYGPEHTYKINEYGYSMLIL